MLFQERNHVFLPGQPPTMTLSDRSSAGAIHGADNNMLFLRYMKDDRISTRFTEEYILVLKQTIIGQSFHCRNAGN